MPLPVFQPKLNPIAQELERKRKEAQDAQDNQTLSDSNLLTSGNSDSSGLVYVRPSQVKDRIKIIFDDSSSMSYGKMDDAIQGCIEFLRNCGFNTTACAIVPLNANLFEMKTLTTNLPLLAEKVKLLKSCGGTPLYNKWVESLSKDVTRFVIFSDGQPNLDEHGKEVAISFCQENKIPCDTVLIWTSDYPPEESREYTELKNIADQTSGIFMVFDRKKVNFKTAFKYLAPVQRLALAANSQMQKDLQEGKLK